MSIRLGILDIGPMGRRHMCSARATAGVDLVTLAGPGDDRFGVTGDLPVLGSIGEIIKVGTDAAIIAAPTAHCEAAALALAEIEVHTLVKKPLATSVEVSRRIHNTLTVAGLVGAIGYAGHCGPAPIGMRRRIAEGQLGAIEQTTTRRQSPFLVRINDVGVVKDLATYDMNLAAWVAGAPYGNIYARMSTHSGRMHGDMMAIPGILAGGILVNHLVNWLTPFKDRTTIVTGERSTLVADTAMRDPTFYENDHAPLQWDAIAAFRGMGKGQVMRYALTKREPLALEHERFRDAILGAGGEHVTMDEVLDNLRIVEAILSSAATDRSVNL